MCVQEYWGLNSCPDLNLILLLVTVYIITTLHIQVTVLLLKFPTINSEWAKTVSSNFNKYRVSDTPMQLSNIIPGID